jgi:hypothetical protein
MKRTVVGMLTLGCCLLASKIAAEECPSGCCKGYTEKVITCYRQECTECQVPVVVKRLCYREVCEPVKTTVMVPKEFCEKRTKVNVIDVPVQQIKYVTKTRQVPVKMMDPCTGCCIMSCRTECYQVPCPYTVMTQRYETVCYDVKVCRMVPCEKIEMVKRQVPDYRCETIYQTKRNCVMVPYQKTIRVPCPSPESGAYRVEVPLSTPNCPTCPCPVPPSYAPPAQPLPPAYAPPAHPMHRHQG